MRQVVGRGVVVVVAVAVAVVVAAVAVAVAVAVVVAVVAVAVRALISRIATTISLTTVRRMTVTIMMIVVGKYYNHRN